MKELSIKEKASINFPKPIGFLEHEATLSRFGVYKHIPLFQRLALKWFFGLTYKSK